MRRFDVPGGWFHTNRFNSSNAPGYKDWTKNRRRECSVALVDVILNHTVGSVAISVPAPAIRAAAVPPRMKGRVGHPYGIASRLCMVEAAGLLLGTLKIESELTINHVFAEGASGYGQLLAAHEHESFRPRRVKELALGSFSVGRQPDQPPLQAADFLTWEVNRLVRLPQSPIRASLRRFWTLPHRWYRLEEDAVGAHILMSASVEMFRGEIVRSRRRARANEKRA